MAKSNMVLKLSGFEELLKQIEQAGGSINQAAESCVRESAQIMKTELKNQMAAAGVSASLIKRMPEPRIEVAANSVTARVGYDMGDFDSKNPSDGYKAVFLNYGTPRRTKHGKVKPRGFIAKAKKAAKPKIQKAQQEALNKILERAKR